MLHQLKLIRKPHHKQLNFYFQASSSSTLLHDVPLALLSSPCLGSKQYYQNHLHLTLQIYKASLLFQPSRVIQDQYQLLLNLQLDYSKDQSTRQSDRVNEESGSLRLWLNIFPQHLKSNFIVIKWKYAAIYILGELGNSSYIQSIQISILSLDLIYRCRLVNCFRHQCLRMLPIDEHLNRRKERKSGCLSFPSRAKVSFFLFQPRLFKLNIYFYQIGQNLLLVHAQLKTSPDINLITTSTCCKGVSGAKEVVIEMHFFPLDSRWSIILVHSKLIDLVGYGLCCHSTYVLAALPTKNLRLLLRVTILQLALLQMGLTSSSGAPFSTQEFQFI